MVVGSPVHPKQEENESDGCDPGLAAVRPLSTTTTAYLVYSVVGGVGQRKSMSARAQTNNVSFGHRKNDTLIQRNPAIFFYTLECGPIRTFDR